MSKNRLSDSADTEFRAVMRQIGAAAESLRVAKNMDGGGVLDLEECLRHLKATNDEIRRASASSGGIGGIGGIGDN